MSAPDHLSLVSDPARRDSFIVLTPVFNDWEVLRLLLARLDAELAAHCQRASVIVVNDGSQSPAQLSDLAFSSIQTLEVLHLRRNLGHQRAIAVGLAFVEARVPCSAVAVMDADGEDRPEDVPRLLERAHAEGGTKVVFALRRRRSEGLLFRTFYTLYRWAFQGLTGQGIRVGNFSLVPRAALGRLVAASEIWNHYAAGVQRARVPCVYLPTDRGKRLAGHSTMNFVSLLTHGMSAISVHAETVGSRMLLLAGALGVAIVLAMGVVVAIRFLTDLAIPGWATFVMGLLSMMLLQTFFMALVFAGTVLHARNTYTFLPSRDHVHFVDWLEAIDVARCS
jgi:polyisoprenyl-phosphate glycosyltransferase